MALKNTFFSDPTSKQLFVGDHKMQWTNLYVIRTYISLLEERWTASKICCQYHKAWKSNNTHKEVDNIWKVNMHIYKHTWIWKLGILDRLKKNYSYHIIHSVVSISVIPAVSFDKTHTTDSYQAIYQRSDHQTIIMMGSGTSLQTIIIT